MGEATRILLIDDEEGMCRMLAAVLGDHGFATTWFTRAAEALETFVPATFDLAVTDIRMPGGIDGIEVLRRLRAADPDLPVIIITAYATVEMSIEALRQGAWDMITKPFEPEELLYRIKNALAHTRLLEENRALREELVGKFHCDRLIGASAALRRVLDTVEKIAIRDTPVLITGESGTGKELVAQAIHHNSLRREQRFLAINCGALPESVLVSELFGHVKGSFTGATEDREGLLAAADGGTLFLDEIGNLPMPVQQLLLRFLQEREFHRIGDRRPTRVDVRLISATNADLKQAVAMGTFREDLYYRIDVVNIHLPPLRERAEDIPALTTQFIRENNERFGTRITGVTPAVMGMLRAAPWPGNIRQLKNVIEAGMAMESDSRLTPEVIAPLLAGRAAGTPGGGEGGAGDGDETPLPAAYTEALADFETRYLIDLLARCGGNVEAAAREAGMNIATIYRKLKKYGIDRTNPA
ncbi:MAG: sigma-54-dependent Fis family transcriptional regulator [Deltaproteobacteria bacterium]|nr:sigma-54-dependent Fis family transcriptional regulator [Candidatus Anaeroferrophillacea bacterium]